MVVRKEKEEEQMEEEEGGKLLLLDDDDANVAAAGNGSGCGRKEGESSCAENSSAAATATTSLLDAKSLKAIRGGADSEKPRAAAREAEGVAAEHAKQSIARALNERLFCRATTFAGRRQQMRE